MSGDSLAGPEPRIRAGPPSRLSSLDARGTVGPTVVARARRDCAFLVCMLAEPTRAKRGDLRVARWVLILIGLAASSCRESRAPGYVRVSGAAPRLIDAPQSPALLVSFWATWCPPCREETPALKSLAKDPPEGIRVVIVSEDESLDEVHAFLGGAPDPALHLRLDDDGALMRAFDVDRLPATFLVVDGRLVARFTGPRNWDSSGMRKLLERLLAEAQASTPPAAAP